MRKIAIVLFIIFIVFSLYAFDMETSIWVPTLKSTLLPGWGFYNTPKENYFIPQIITEGTIVGFLVYSNYRKNDISDYSKRIAYEYSGAPMYINDDHYWDNVEWYRSIDEYREQLWNKARSIYGDDYISVANYVAENDIPDSLSWYWQNDSLRTQYGYERTDYRKWLNVTFYTTIGLVSYHLLSGVITYLGLDMEVDPNSVSISKSF